MEGDERASENAPVDDKMDGPKPNGASALKKERRSASTSPNDSKAPSRSSSMSPGANKAENESASTPDTEPAPKLSRKSSTKVRARTPPLFDHLPDATDEAKAGFQVITDCLYGSKNMGSSVHDALDCDCAEEWQDGVNLACGDDSNCINRATKMECVDADCNCGLGCQNQRFQQKQYADVSVFKTEKKGFGLRANIDLQPNEFIFEYVGEVINEPTFRRRTVQYNKEKIKHFYFMSLTRTEFIDATKKGNLGRFCNHSCNPNCYVDKWVVGDKVRMGIFTIRAVRAGEELVFDYNVDRYGAEPQPCYCGEPNCTGFLGGKTQTERAVKLPSAIMEAMGIEDGDGWETTVAKKLRKKKANETDEEYVQSLQLPSLDDYGVQKVMAALMQCKEKWIAVKLLGRLQTTDDEGVLNTAVQMHGYQILKTVLTNFQDDNNVVLQVLDILYKLPRLTKNKITDSKIEPVIEGLTSSDHLDVAAESKRLVEIWSKLETAYRIPRKKPAVDLDTKHSMAYQHMERYRRRDISPPPFKEERKFGRGLLPGVNVPKGPKSNIPQRNAVYWQQQMQRRRNFVPANALPRGWYMARDPRGNMYYYNNAGTTTWQRPTVAADAAKVPSKEEQDKKAVQDIIDSLTKEPTPRASVSLTPQQQTTPIQEAKEDKWRSLPIEKQMKIYENTIFPQIKYMMDKFRHKLPKDVLKRHAKEVSKTLVNSDYKHNRVDDPTAITDKQEKKVRHYVKEYLDKAVVKYHEHEKRKAGRHGHEHKTGESTAGDIPALASVETPSRTQAADEDVTMSDAPSSPMAATNNNNNNSNNKRKREDEDMLDVPSMTPEEEESAKRLKESPEEPGPPPPPPPPPEEDAMGDMTPSQVEAFSRAEEEAQRLADEAEQDRIRQEEDLQRENEEAMRDFELEQAADAAAQAAAHSNGHVAGQAEASQTVDNHEQEANGGSQQQVIIGQ